jgi:flagellin-like hook-associated protein FlgL
VLDVVNASGVVTAEVTDAGKLKISGSDAETVNLSIVDTGGDASTATTQATSLAASLGFGTNSSVDLSDPADGDYVDAGETAVTFTDGATSAAADTLSITTQANPAANSSTRQKLVSQFNNILEQIDKLAEDASFNGVNLINSSSSKLTVAFNEKRDATSKSELSLTGEDLTSSGLNITRTSSLSDSEANNALDELSNALLTLREAGSKFGSNLSTVQIRKDYTKASINTLQTGADNLVLADTNEEGANLLALQTRQQLSTTALSMASQADQAVLRLF